MMPKKLKLKKSLTSILEDVRLDIKSEIEKGNVNPNNKNQCSLVLNKLYKKHKIFYNIIQYGQFFKP